MLRRGKIVLHLFLQHAPFHAIGQLEEPSGLRIPVNNYPRCISQLLKQNGDLERKWT